MKEPPDIEAVIPPCSVELGPEQWIELLNGGPLGP